jgi:excisionase family DNA binding protein
MTTQFIRSESALFPPPARARGGQPITRVEVVLGSGERATLTPLAVRLLEELRDGLASDKVAHVELDEELVSAERAAELLGVSRPTIYTWQDRGRLGRADIGAKRKVPLKDVERLRNSRIRNLVLGDIADEPDAPLTAEEAADLRELLA